MIKKGRLTDSEKYFIDKMIDDEIDVVEMARKLERSPNAIKNYVEKMAKAYTKKFDDTTKPSKPNTFFINKTAANKSGISIMTEAASMNSDVKKPTGPTSVIQKSCFQIFPDDKKKK